MKQGPGKLKMFADVGAATGDLAGCKQDASGLVTKQNQSSGDEDRPKGEDSTSAQYDPDSDLTGDEYSDYWIPQSKRRGKSRSRRHGGNTQATKINKVKFNMDAMKKSVKALSAELRDTKDKLSKTENLLVEALGKKKQDVQENITQAAETTHRISTKRPGRTRRPARGSPRNRPSHCRGQDYHESFSSTSESTSSSSSSEESSSDDSTSRHRRRGRDRRHRKAHGGSQHAQSSEVAAAINRNEDHSDKATVEEEVKAIWEKEQLELKRRLVPGDLADWARFRVTPMNTAEHPFVKPLQYLGGVDISFVKGDNVNACAALTVVELPSLEVVYADCSHVKLTAPYIPGFLAFREVKFLVDKIEKLRQTSPEFMPQVILCDGNGILHPREFGVACHLGVLLDLPTLGCAKKLFQVFGLEKNEEHKKKIEQLEKGQDGFPLIADSGQTLGYAMRSNDNTKNPIYVSPGHQLSVETAVWVVQQCCPYRVPEPVRQADQRSREFLREMFPEEQESPKKQPKGSRKTRSEASGKGHSRNSPTETTKTKQDSPESALHGIDALYEDWE